MDAQQVAEPRVQALAAQVREAARAGRPLRIRAGGTKDFYGNPCVGELLDPRGWRGIAAYDPAELYVTARAGTPLAELEDALAAQGQMLAFEPPHFGAGATVGGCVAAGLAGPRRCAAGTAHGGLRDFVLGARLLDGRGRVLSFGGTVMKNVAGYDLSRALAGSLGLLGVILDVTLKVLPRPRTEATLCFEFDEAGAVTQANRWAGRSLPLSASLWHAGLLCVRLSGAEGAVREAMRSMGGEAMDASMAQALWTDVREQRHAAFAGDDDAPLWRLALPATAPPPGLPGLRLIEWHGAQRWLRCALPAEQLRARAVELGGHATLFRGGAGRTGVFTPPPAPLMAIQRRLQHEFDPAGLFNRGRMFPEPAGAAQGG